MKHLRLIPDDTRIPFMAARHIALAFSGLLALATLIGWFSLGFNFGIDFTGGTVIEARNKAGAVDPSHVREMIDRLSLGEAHVQGFADRREDVMIRLPQQAGGEDAQQAAVQKVRNALGDSFELRSVDVVGPAVSADLRRDAVIAIILSIGAILGYLWIRFEWQYAVGAILTTIHDVVLTLGLMIFFQIPFDLPILAAILTIIGYSLNDTVVIYDRIREMMRKYKRMPLQELIDLSINQTLSRTIVTSITILIASLALLVFGGEALRGFNMIMVFGVVVGTYSSIVISAPLLIYLRLRSRDAGSAAKSGEPAPAKG